MLRQLRELWDVRAFRPDWRGFRKWTPAPRLVGITSSDVSVERRKWNESRVEKRRVVTRRKCLRNLELTFNSFLSLMPVAERLRQQRYQHTNHAHQRICESAAISFRHCRRRGIIDVRHGHPNISIAVIVRMSSSFLHRVHRDVQECPAAEE